MQPSMLHIEEELKKQINLPYAVIQASDNLCSSVTIWASFDHKDNWPNKILHNSRYFIAHIRPKNRYYTNGDDLTVEISASSHKLPKFRKYTSTPEKVIQKFANWIKENT